jgi:hypothetical protein
LRLIKEKSLAISAAGVADQQLVNSPTGPALVQQIDEVRRFNWRDELEAIRCRVTDRLAPSITSARHGAGKRRDVIRGEAVETAARGKASTALA